MAIIGSLGDTIFSVSRSKINTFDSIKWDSSVNYSEIDRHLKDPLLEYTGTGADRISFSMYFSVFLGVNPLDEIVKLLNAERKGTIMFLIIGPKKYGKNKWVIDKTSKTLERFDNKGNILTAKVDVSLIAYAER